jgi:hypothetical protein
LRFSQSDQLSVVARKVLKCLLPVEVRCIYYWFVHLLTIISIHSAVQGVGMWGRHYWYKILMTLDSGGGGILSLTEIVVADLVPLRERGTFMGVIGS